MSGLLYYLPGQGLPVTLGDLRAKFGLGHAFDPADQPITVRSVRRGPDGGEGAVVVDERRVSAASVGFFPDRQQWWRVPGSAAWVGRFTGESIVPADLQREVILPGHDVKLADGQSYHVPIARGLAEEADELRYFVALPRKSTIDDEGRWVEGDVDDRYAELWSLAERWADAVVDAKTEHGRTMFELRDSHDGALAALAANYRLGKAEVALLGLFNRRVVYDVLLALIDWPAYEEFHKKKAARAGGATGAGQPVGTGDTDPASPTVGPSPKASATSPA